MKLTIIKIKSKENWNWVTFDKKILSKTIYKMKSIKFSTYLFKNRIFLLFSLPQFFVICIGISSFTLRKTKANGFFSYIVRDLYGLKSFFEAVFFFSTEFLELEPSFQVSTFIKNSSQQLWRNYINSLN